MRSVLDTAEVVCGLSCSCRSCVPSVDAPAEDIAVLLDTAEVVCGLSCSCRSCVPSVDAPAEDMRGLQLLLQKLFTAYRCSCRRSLRSVFAPAEVCAVCSCY